MGCNLLMYLGGTSAKPIKFVMECIEHSMICHPVICTTCALGATCVPPGPKDFSSGDKVKAELDMEVVTSVLEGGGGSDGMMDSMLEVK